MRMVRAVPRKDGYRVRLSALAPLSVRLAVGRMALNHVDVGSNPTLTASPASDNG